MARYDSGARYDTGVLYDATQPGVISARALEPDKVEVLFDDAMTNNADLINPASYSIPGLAVLSVAVISIDATNFLTTIHLQTATQKKQTYILTVSSTLQSAGGFIDPGTRVVSFLGIEARINRVLSFLVLPLRQLDKELAIGDPAPGGRGLLERYLIGPETIDAETRERIQTLTDQYRPDKARSDVLKYLKDIVGFDSPAMDGITSRLTEDGLRRLIKVAGVLWKQRYTKRGLINTIRLLTGRPSIFNNWFYFRNLIGETMIGEDQLVSGGDSWIIGGSVSLYDEFWSNLRVMDDGTLDELLLVDIVRLMRPSSERVEIVLTDFLDHFDTDKSLWTLIAGSDWTHDLTNRRMELPAGTTVEPVIPILPSSSLTQYALITKFRLAASGKYIVRWYHEAADTYYEVAIQSIAPRVELRRVVGGVVTLLESVNPTGVSIVNGTDYKLRLQTINDAGPTRKIRIYIDNVLVIPTTGTDFDDAVATPGNGTWRLRSEGATTIIDNVESWRLPGRFATVEIGTLTEPSGELTMTDNFIQ